MNSKTNYKMKTKTIYHTNENLEVVKIEKRTTLCGVVVKRRFISPCVVSEARRISKIILSNMEFQGSGQKFAPDNLR